MRSPTRSGHSSEALPVRTDVMQSDDLERLVDSAVDRFGRLDVLVNNAGGTMPRPAMDTSEGYFETALRFNVTAAFLLTRLAARQMVDTAGEGAVVNISSRSSDMVQTSFVAYGAAKAALNMMTRNIAAEMAPRGVNAISVGGVATQGLEVVLTDDDLRRQFEEGTPMGRPGTTEDIACAALYLASPAASWVTGKVIQVDEVPKPRPSPFPFPRWSPAPRPDSVVVASARAARLWRCDPRPVSSRCPTLPPSE